MPEGWLSLSDVLNMPYSPLASSALAAAWSSFLSSRRSGGVIMDFPASIEWLRMGVLADSELVNASLQGFVYVRNDLPRKFFQQARF